MLTLFTGAPGAGKTAQMVWELDKLLKSEPNRPIYVDGVNGLTIPHTPIDASKWHEQLPDGALMLVDEAQRLWRPTGPGQKPGPDVQAMETHRHRGIDIWMTTQGPRLIHQNVRALVGRHIHLRDTGWLGRWWYEWPECNEALAWKSCVNKAKHQLPSAIFEKYKSASLHVKPQRRVPRVLYWFIALLLAFSVLAYLTFQSIYSKMAPAKPALPAAVAPGQVAAAMHPGSGLAIPLHRTDASAFVPRWSARPESAPAYDELVKVRTFPRVVAGYCVGAAADRCHCFTQQGTDAGLSAADCREWNHHRPFDPYRAEGAEARTGPTAGTSEAQL